MPSNLVHNASEEAKWERAKTAAGKTKKNKKHWALVNYIYQRMLKKKKGN